MKMSLPLQCLTIRLSCPRLLILNAPNGKKAFFEIQDSPWAPPAFLEGGGQSGKGGANWEGEGGG